MIREGFVKSKKGDKLTVCFERPSSCAGCKGCAKGLMGKNELLTVYDQAQPGDIVVVQMPENHVFEAALLAYALPLCGLIACLMAGDMLDLGDTLSFLMALIGLGAGFVLGRAADKMLSRKKGWRPEIIAVQSGTAEERNTEK